MPRNARSGPALALLASLFTTCGARPRASPSVRVARADAVRTPPAQPRVPTLATWLPVASSGESQARATVSATEPDGTLDVVYGALRAQLGAAGVTWAADVPLRWIATTVRVSGGWVFVANDGTVATSPTFLGPLRVIGRVDRANGDAMVGRLALLDDGGAVWTLDRVDGALARMSLPVAGARSVRFVDAERGALVSTAGTVFVTRDGGGHWSRVDLGDANAAGLVRTATGLAVDTTSGCGPALRGLEARRAEPRDVSDDELARLARSIAEEHPRWLAPLRLGLGVAFASGGEFVGHLGLAQFRRSVHAPLEDIAALSNLRCYFVPWGSVAVAADCGDVLYRVDDAGRARAVLRKSIPNSMAAPFPDGDHVRVEGRCPAEPLAARAASAPGNYWTRPQCLWSVRDRRGVELAARDASLILGPSAYNLGHGDHLERWSLAAPDAPRTRIDLPRAPDGRRLVLTDRAECTADGLFTAPASFAGPGRTPLPAPYQFLGEPDRLRLVALPRDAVRAGFLDRLRGVAAPPGRDRAWVTDDGGATWREVGLGLAPPALSEDTSSSGQPIVCENGACVIDGEVAITTFDGGPVQWTDLTVRPSPPLPDAAPSRPGPSFEAATLTCRPDARGGTEGEDLALEVTWAPGTSSAEHVRFAWHGRDLRGPFDGASPLGVLPAPRARRAAAARAGADWAYRALAATRRGVLAERCAFAPIGQCDLLWASTTRPARVVVHADNPENGGSPMDRYGARALDDGGVAFLWGEESVQWRGGRSCPGDDDSNIGEIVRAVRITPDGIARSSPPLALSFDGRPFFALLTQGSAVALAINDEPAPSRLGVRGADAPSALPTELAVPWPTTLAVCHHAPRTDVPVLTFTASPWSIALTPAEAAVGALLSASVEVAPDGVCVQSLQSISRDETLIIPNIATVVLRATADGTLAGTVARHEGVRAVRCDLRSVR